MNEEGIARLERGDRRRLSKKERERQIIMKE